MNNRETSPVARNAVLGDECLQSLEILQLKLSHIGGYKICSWGTVASILYFIQLGFCGEERRRTRPVAPQHASLASNITILRSFPRSSCRRKCAALEPDIPLPIITTSASVGKDAVVRCPRRIVEGSLCQNDLVELAVGRLAWPGRVVPQAMLVCLGFSAPERCMFESSMMCKLDGGEVDALCPTLG